MNKLKFDALADKSPSDNPPMQRTGATDIVSAVRGCWGAAPAADRPYVIPPEAIAVDAAQIHEMVERYNWDDGLEPIRALIENPKTEFATALLIFWRLDGPWIVPNSGASNDGAGSLNRLVRERLLAGFYPKGKLRFDPTAELSGTQVYKLEKDGLPSELLRPAWAE